MNIFNNVFKINNIIFFLYLLMAFLMPINKKLMPALMISIFLAQLFNGWWIEFKNADKKIWLLCILYIIYVFGLLYTSNFEYGLFDMQIKIPLLLFSLIVAGAKSIINTNFFKGIIIATISGTIVSAIICLSIGLYQYFLNGDSSFLSYSKLSIFHHPSYAALFVCLSAIGLLWLLFSLRLKLIQKGLIYFLLTFLVFYSVMLSSKAGFISIVFVFLIAIAYLIIIKRKFLFALAIFGFSVVVFYSASKSLAFVINRITEAVTVVKDNKTEGGTADRLNVWKSSVEIIKRHTFIGVGTGDVKDSLIAQYKVDGFSSAFEKKLNAHNQYLQTFVTLGILGILSLLALLLYPLWLSFKNRDFLYFTFIIVFAFNILVESMLEVQAGVVFFAFFNSLFFVNIIQQKHKK